MVLSSSSSVFSHPVLLKKIVKHLSQDDIETKLKPINVTTREFVTNLTEHCHHHDPSKRDTSDQWWVPVINGCFSQTQNFSNETRFRDCCMIAACCGQLEWLNECAEKHVLLFNDTENIVSIQSYALLCGQMSVVKHFIPPHTNVDHWLLQYIFLTDQVRCLQYLHQKCVMTITNEHILILLQKDAIQCLTYLDRNKLVDLDEIQNSTLFFKGSRCVEYLMNKINDNDNSLKQHIQLVDCILSGALRSGLVQIVGKYIHLLDDNQKISYLDCLVISNNKQPRLGMHRYKIKAYASFADSTIARFGCDEFIPFHFYPFTQVKFLTSIAIYNNRYNWIQCLLSNRQLNVSMSELCREIATFGSVELISKFVWKSIYQIAKCRVRAIYK
jgi:hypothetical protein